MDKSFLGFVGFVGAVGFVGFVINVGSVIYRDSLGTVGSVGSVGSVGLLHISSSTVCFKLVLLHYRSNKFRMLQIWLKSINTLKYRPKM